MDFTEANRLVEDLIAAIDNKAVKTVGIDNANRYTIGYLKQLLVECVIDVPGTNHIVDRAYQSTVDIDYYNDLADQKNYYHQFG